MAKLVHECVNAIYSGDGHRIRALADCCESVYKVDVKHEWRDPVFFALSVAWHNSGQKMTSDGRRRIPHYRADILRFVRNNFRDQGLGECTDKRLREAMNAYRYVHPCAPRGGKREGAGRKPDSVVAILPQQNESMKVRDHIQTGEF